MNRWLTAILCLVCSLLAAANERQANENEESPVITLRLRDTALPDILEEIERQAGVSFSYESSLMEGLPKTDFTAERERLESCLDRLLAAYPIGYRISGRMIVLKRKTRMVTISGFVRDAGSAESLIGASVYETGSRVGAASNSYGFFSLTLPAGEARINASYIGYESRSLHFASLARDTTLRIELRPNARLEEVVVTGEERQQARPTARNTLMGAMGLSQQSIKTTPTLFGESDIVRTLQLTPGVSSGTEGLAGLYVRGGDLDGNLFLIDNNPVYQVNHVGGLFSAFNPEAVRGMDFFKAGFPARYGGRLSSVVDVHTKEGNMRAYHGSASIGLISGNLSLEGPIVKDRTAFQLSLRRSWLDAISAPAVALVNLKAKKEGEHYNIRYAFHDLNAKVTHRFSDRDRMFVSVYNGNDLLKGGSRESNRPGETENPYLDRTGGYLRWGNLMATVGWTHLFNNRLFGRVSGVFTRYRSHISTLQSYSSGREGEADYLLSSSETSNVTSILDMGVRSLFDYLPVAKHRVRFGGDLLIHRFRPEYNEVKIDGQSDAELSTVGRVYSNDLLWAREAALFAEDDWDINRALRVNGGVRLSLFNVQRKTYALLEPRLALRWLLRDNLSVKGSFARMGQYIHLMSNSYVNLPTDAWMPVTRQLKPLVSDQISLGTYFDWLETYSFSVESYFKWMRNLLDYKDGYSFLPGTTYWQDKLTSGKGRSYGVEFLARKESGRTTGWIGYTLSWADRRFAEIDGGRRFPARYDNRHKLNIVVSHRLSKRVELTAAWTYASGNRMTLSLESYDKMGSVLPLFDGYNPPVDNWQSPGGEQVDFYTRRNNYQLPAYHRLDLGINIYRPKKRGRMGIWNISIYNVYSRMNPFLAYKERSPRHYYPLSPGVPNYSYYNTMSVPKFKTVGFMPIIPSISYTYKF